MTEERGFARDFILVSIAQFNISFVFCILLPTIPIYLSSFNVKEAEIGLLVGSLSVSSLLLRPIVGRALMTTPERRFMIVGAFLYIVASLAYLWAPPFWPLMIVRILHGVGLAFFATSAFTRIANIVPDSRRGQMVSYFYLANNVAFALAPYIGIHLYNDYGFKVVFGLSAVLSAAALVISAKLGKTQGLPLGEGASRNQPLLSRAALSPAFMAFMVNLIWGAITAFFPLYALSQGVRNPGLFFAAFALMLILGRGFGGRLLDLYDRDKVMFPCLIAYPLSMGIMAFSKTMASFLLVAVIWGAGNAFLYPSLLILAIHRAGALRGPAMGTFTAVADLGTGMGAMIMGAILQASSYRVMFLCLVWAGVLNFLYFHLFVRKKGGDRHAHL